MEKAKIIKNGNVNLERVTLTRRLLNDAIDQLKGAQMDHFVQDTQDVIDDLNEAAIVPSSAAEKSLEQLQFWKAELDKCMASPLYFYNTYVKRADLPPLSQADYDRYCEHVMKQRNTRVDPPLGNKIAHPDDCFTRLMTREEFKEMYPHETLPDQYVS